MGNKDLNIYTKVIFLTAAGNLNSAPFNRFITIVKAVKLVNFKVDIINIKPVKKKNIGKNVSLVDNKFIYKNILFENIQVISEKDNLLKKKYLRLKTYYFAGRIIGKKIIKGKTILYLNPVQLIDYIFFFIVARLYNIKYVKERSEYPILIRNQRKIKTNFFKYLILPWCYKLFDGMVIMTDSLISFYSKYTRKKCKIAKITMTVDSDRFSFNKINNEKYIGYVGGLNCKKDGLDILIKAYNKIHKEFPDYTLKIVGASDNPEEKKYLVELSKSLSIGKKVQLLGEKTREEIPEFLCKASLLVLSRPESKQAEGGFPTKLGEYLVTGNPVITTNVGEISDYIRNETDAYIIKPGDIDALADKIRYILQNPQEARRTGMEGRKTAVKLFDYRSQTIKLQEFIESVIEKKG